MVHVEIADLYKKRYAALWSLLSFKAGLLNAAGFLIAGSYVAHVTGFGTQIGLAFGHGNSSLALELLIIPVAFVSGALITSLILDKNYSKQNVPNYPLVQLTITALLGLISAGFTVGAFRSNAIAGDPQKDDIVLIGLLCLVCGLKNGLTTWASHGKIRTTHLTGLSTDIGLHLPKVFQKEGANSRYPEPKKVTYVRLATLASFSIGSCISALLVPSLGANIFYLSFAISAVLSVISVTHRRRKISAIQSLNLGGRYANVN